MSGFLLRCVINTVGIIVIAHLLRGIEVEGVLPALVAALTLGVLNAVVRPILIILTLPLTILSLGLFLLVINGFMLYFVGNVVKGFHVTGFWPAFFGALLLAVVGWVTSAFVSDRGRIELVR